MDNQKIKVEDESGDRKYFTIIPNLVLNHSTATAQALYMQLKRLAGERGVAYPGSRYLMDKLGISQPTLRKELRYLLEKGWIEFAGEKEISTDGGRQKVTSYRVVDLWELNARHYARGEKIEAPQEAQGVKARGEKIVAKEEPLEEEHKIPAAGAASPSSLVSGEAFPLRVETFFDKPRVGKDDSALPMSLPEFVLLCRGSASRAVRLVGEYADERRLAFETRGQWREIGRRNLGVAKRLSPFSDRQIADAVRRAKKDFKTEGGFISKWGLETLEKYLEEAVAKI